MREKLFIQIGDEVREYTEEEYAQAEIDKATQVAAAEAAAAEAAAAKEAKETAETKLAALGLTTDDLKALGLGVN